MTVAELRAILVSLLSSELGLYTNGLPSIWIYGSSSQPPSASSGLEVLIQELPIGCPNILSSGQRYEPREWEIVLKNYTKSSKLSQAIAKIKSRFILRKCRVLPATSTTLEQARISIFDPTIINPY